MKRRWLVLIPTLFLLLINITLAAELPTIAGVDSDGDRMVQPRQHSRELQNQIDVQTQQLGGLAYAPGLPPGVVTPDLPWLSERPGSVPFSFEQPNGVRVVRPSPFRDPRPLEYNGMTFWWIPLSTTVSSKALPATSPGTVKLLEPN